MFSGLSLMITVMITVVSGRGLLDKEREALSMVGKPSLTSVYLPLTSALPVVTVNCLNQSEKFNGLWSFLSFRSLPAWHQHLLGRSSLIAFGVGARYVTSLQAPELLRGEGLVRLHQAMETLGPRPWLMVGQVICSLADFMATSTPEGLPLVAIWPTHPHSSVLRH